MRPVQVQKVINAMESIAPTRLAEPWDNVGMLIDTLRKDFPAKFKVFLTNDLTEKVAQEAIKEQAHMIISYHPTPFSKFNKLLATDHISRVVLLLAREQIAVYSHHTGLDCAVPGVNDWLLEAFPGVVDVTACQPKKDEPVPIGCGRVATIEELDLPKAVELVKKHLDLPTVRLAPRHTSDIVKTKDEALKTGGKIQRIAVCAGSGASVFRGLSHVDLLVTGEMSHHEVLAATQNGQNVILTEHSNTERGYLKVLKKTLDTELGVDFEVVISQSDADPLLVA